MIQKNTLKKIIIDQQQLFSNFKGIKREKLKVLSKGSEITIISGLRRCGKSTLLNQIRQNNSFKKL